MDNFFEKTIRFKDNVAAFFHKTFAASGKVDKSHRISRELRAGDIIAVSRKLPYQHFAVYIGDNKVIHFAAQNGDWGGKDNKITIHEAPFEEFLRDSTEFEILEFDEKRHEPMRYVGLMPLGKAMKGFSVIGTGINIIPSLGVILNGMEIYKNLKYHLYTPEETVQRAKEVAGKCVQEGKAFEVYFNGKKYNLVFNNCEHFAIWCKTGIHESKQVDKIIKFIASISGSII